ncbi:hypothetical protein EST38_g2857 [Candolleomyces aberdarensis]|uniref:Plasma membrane fusion protein PRM1 n=1 Tax=Candolleomyces aberdarensis TaxID=2316362 RepID=A0A4Q2DTL7_9AGAR|nr:hypothetical protein EST38_g2857 [Candolleomyces aberdarensis]
MAFYAQQPPSYDAPHTTLTPYLQLSHLLSLTWLAYPIISLIFVAFRLSSSLDAAKDAIASAKDNLLASCRAAEEAATSAASMPRYMALATNQQFADAVNASLRGARQALTLSLTVMEAIINFIIDLYRSIFLCFLELVVRGGLAILIGAVNELNNVISTVTSGLRTSIQNDIAGANRAISGAFDVINRINPFNDIEAPQIPAPNLDGLANIQIPGSFQESLVRLNETIPTVSSIKEKLEEIINTPFELLKKDINDTFATIQFDGSALPVPEQSRVSFCSELDMSVVDDIGRDIIKAFKIGIVILIVLALVLIGLNCLLTWYKWRCMKSHLEYTRQAWNTDPTMVHTKGSISSAPQVTLSDHNLMMLHANSSHPLITRITNQISTRLRFTPTQHTNFQWFFNYIFHPPAAACLLIGFFGLLLVEIQLLALGPMVAKYQGQAAETSRDFSLLIANSINENMLNQSTIYAQQVNAEVDTIQNTINNGVFGWVNVTTTQLNTTINEFYDDVQNAVNTVFGGTILETPATEFIRCLIGSKVDAIENALTFLHDNLRVDMPRVNNTALLLNPDSVNEASAPIAAAALGGGAEDDQGLVGRLVNSYANILKQERVTFGIFLGLWGIVVLMGICVLLWHSYGRPLIERRRRRRYQMEQRGGLPDNLFRDGSVTPPSGRASRDEKWEGGMAVSDLPNFTPLPSPRRSVFKPFWASSRSNTPVPPQEPMEVMEVMEVKKNESLGHGSQEKVSRLKAIRMKMKPGAKSDPENGEQDNSSSGGGWLGKVKGVFAKKEEAEPDPEFWESYNQRPKLKIFVDTPSDRSYAPQEEENPNKPLPASRWSTSPTEASWKSLLSPKKTSSPKVTVTPALPEPTVNRSLPPPPGLRHKASVPSDIGSSFDDPFLRSTTPSPVPGLQSNNPYGASIIPSLYPIPLHSVYQGNPAPSALVPPPTRRVPPSPPKAPSHKRTSSVPVWRVTNSTPADQLSVSSGNTSSAGTPTTIVRPLPPTPPRELIPGHARHPSLAEVRASEVNPFITPFDDEHRVKITSGHKARKSMSANPFAGGVAF